MRLKLLKPDYPGCIREEDTNYGENDVGDAKKVSSPQACAEQSAFQKALFWTFRYEDGTCWVKSSDSGRKSEAGLVSGTRACAFPQLTPIGMMASQRSDEYPLHLCADSNPSTYCVVGKAPFPWLALVLGSKARVDRVEIKHRGNCCGETLRNIEVRVTDELPTTGDR